MEAGIVAIALGLHFRLAPCSAWPSSLIRMSIFVSYWGVGVLGRRSWSLLKDVALALGDLLFVHALDDVVDPLNRDPVLHGQLGVVEAVELLVDLQVAR